MLRPRVIPVLQLCNGNLVKTKQFKNPTYIGDPINAVRIFNQKRVDELIINDITPNRAARGPDLAQLKQLFSECQMPVCYGGGITDLETATKLYHLGCEKLLFNRTFYDNPACIKQIATNFGAQAVSISLDYQFNLFGKVKFYKNSGQTKVPFSLPQILERFHASGAGELVLHHIHHDGTFKGYDLRLLQAVKPHIQVPIVLLGGCDKATRSDSVVAQGAHSVAAGSRFLYHGEQRAVLITYERF